MLVQAAVAADVPFRLLKGIIVVEATPAGARRPMQFIFDTGAGRTVVARHAAEEIGLAHTADRRVRMTGGSRAAGQADRLAIRLGRDFHYSASPLVVDLSREARTLGAPLDGLVGADFFDGRMVCLDFKGSRLRISPPAPPGPGATRVPLVRSSDGLFLKLTVDGEALERVRLDTGCSRELCWAPGRGIFRDGGTRTVNVQLGGRRVAEVASEVFRRPPFAGEDGLLGAALLRRFQAVWIDPAGGRVTFGPPAR